jgi:hypothetical protein
MFKSSSHRPRRSQVMWCFRDGPPSHKISTYRKSISNTEKPYVCLPILRLFYACSLDLIRRLGYRAKRLVARSSQGVIEPTNHNCLRVQGNQHQAYFGSRLRVFFLSYLNPHSERAHLIGQMLRFEDSKGTDRAVSRKPREIGLSARLSRLKRRGQEACRFWRSCQ